VKLLFVKSTLAWPRVSGHDVHTFNLMVGCTRLGHTLSLATAAPVTPEAVQGLPLAAQYVFASDSARNGAPASPLSGFQERFRSYWGVPAANVAKLRDIASTEQPDAVVGGGLDILPYLPKVPAVRVWYAADEWIIHHLSLCRARDGRQLDNLRAAAIKGLYERVYARDLDRAWVVSETEARAMRWLAGVRHVDIVPNGVDSDFFVPQAGPEAPRSAVFWGRLDFEPNIQGLQWFCKNVWPVVTHEFPDATFTVIGFNPTAPVKALAGVGGVTIQADVPDLRAMVGRQAVVVLPFVSGGGIKNKLLEAASMAKAIVASPRATSGLQLGSANPLRVARSPDEWRAALSSLWTNDVTRAELGQAARTWVRAEHTWTAAASRAVRGIEESVKARRAT
jgi:glycosyltransferase involved in cell wall biosynthesis